MKVYKNQLAQNDLTIKIAKAGKLPTISANGGISTSNTSMNSNGLGKQLKTNFSVGGGVGVSIPLFENRSTKNYWLQATTNQSQFKAAKVSSESAQTSYNLLSEQFKLGLKNIVELRTGKDNLLKAKQNELQAKYLAILNINMLKFYKEGHI